MSAQRALSTNGNSLSADGILGPNTKNAIQQYQASHNLPQTGQLDSATLNLLNESGTTTPSTGGSSATENPTGL
jgi:peptidoglycan hydrolase-like protein with peptidoglycan-binding domain